MRIHTFPTVCDVCGGEGMGTFHAARAMWNPGATVVHTNPEVCRSVLERERRKLDEAKRAAAQGDEAA